MKRLSELIAMAIIQNNAPLHPQNWFFSFSGHVNSFEIRFYIKGYDNVRHEDCEHFQAYLDKEEDIEKAILFLEKNLTNIGS